MILSDEASKGRDEIKEQYAAVFAKNLENAILSSKFGSKKAFAQACEVSPGMINLIIRENRLPSSSLLIKMADMLDISVDSLLGRETKTEFVKSYKDAANMLLILIDLGIIEVKAFGPQTNAWLADRLGHRNFDIYLKDETINDFMDAYFFFCFKQKESSDEASKEYFKHVFKRRLNELEEKPLSDNKQ